jgi:hypothetical protein
MVKDNRSLTELVSAISKRVERILIDSAGRTGNSPPFGAIDYHCNLDGVNYHINPGETLHMIYKGRRVLAIRLGEDGQKTYLLRGQKVFEIKPSGEITTYLPIRWRTILSILEGDHRTAVINHDFFYIEGITK